MWTKTLVALTGLTLVWAVVGSFVMTWLIIHGAAELGQYVALYDWEPSWSVTFFATLVGHLVTGLVRSTS